MKAPGIAETCCGEPLPVTAHNATGLIRHAHGRSAQVRSKVRNTMRLIEKEIEKNDGLYPYHGGRLSQAEFCRRAAINQVTLLRDSHRKTTKCQVDAWLRDVNAKLITGKKVVRKTVTKRVDEWKSRYEAVATKFHLYKIQAIAQDELLSTKDARIAELEGTVLQLRGELSEGKVIHMPKLRKGKPG
jgi:hypothetical protein